MVMVVGQPLGRLVDFLDWIDGGLERMESKIFGGHSVRLRQSDRLLEFCNSFKPARFVIRLILINILKT